MAGPYTYKQYLKAYGGVDIKEIPPDFLDTYVRILVYNGPEEANYNLEAYKGAIGMSGEIIDKTFTKQAKGGLVSLNQMTQPIGIM